jgi:hypothetical protein
MSRVFRRHAPAAAEVRWLGVVAGGNWCPRRATAPQIVFANVLISNGYEMGRFAEKLFGIKDRNNPRNRVRGSNSFGRAIT